MMDASALIPFIVNGSLAVVVIILIISQVLVPGWIYRDKKAEADELKKALDIERQRGDAAVAAASATRELLQSIRSDANVPKA
jgi:type II secretory pathway pseudopilin PulG